jgi:hypothetical protein
MIFVPSHILRVSGLLVVACALMAQTKEGHYSISGAVINSGTSEPIPNTVVSLWKIPNFEEPMTDEARMVAAQEAAARKVTLSGIAGEFQFTALVEGRYRLSAQKPGFILNLRPGDQGQGVVNLTASASGVALRLAPLGVIQGSVMTQDGEPWYGVRIEAFTTAIADGVLTTTLRHNAVSDDRGIFRMWGLQPGQYYLKAAGTGLGTYMYVGDGTSRPESWLSFAPVYAGGARTLDAATPVSIAAGTEARADFRLDMEPAVDIRGSLENFIPHQTVTFSMLQGDEDIGAASRVNLNGTTGKFDIQGVTAGDYTLRAVQGQTARGEVKVHVSGDGLSGLVLPLWPAVTVSGTVHNVGPAPTSPSATPDESVASDVFEMMSPPGCQVSLASPGPSIGASQFSLDVARQPGTINIPNVFPGEYRVRIECQGGYATSAMSGTSDLLANPRMTIQPGSTPPPIEITMKLGGGTVHGTLALIPVPPQIWLLLVPLFSSSTGPIFEPAGHDRDSPEQIEFGVSFLAPGDYMIYAFSDAGSVEFRNPAVLQSLTGGTSVRIEDGKTSEVKLNTVVK